MPADFYINKQRRMVYSSATEVFTYADVLDHMERLQRHADFDPEFNQLVDFREVATLTLSSEDVRQLAKIKIFSAHSKRAFVAPSDLVFGMSRMFAIYREIAGENGIRVFREIKEAVSWLSHSSSADPKTFTLPKTVSQTR